MKFNRKVLALRLDAAVAGYSLLEGDRRNLIFFDIRVLEEIGNRFRCALSAPVAEVHLQPVPPALSPVQLLEDIPRQFILLFWFCF